MNHIIQINNNFTACVQSVHHQHAWSQTVAPLVNCSLDNIQFRVNPRLRQAFLQVTDVTNLCFAHALQHNTPNYIIYKSIRWSYTIHLMQFSLVIYHCNITFFIFRLSQRSVATLIRWGGWSSYHHMCEFIAKSNTKNCIKIGWNLTKLYTKIRWLLFMAHGVHTGWPKNWQLFCSP